MAMKQYTPIFKENAFKQAFGTEPQFDFTRKDLGYPGAREDLNRSLKYLSPDAERSILRKLFPNEISWHPTEFVTGRI